MPNLDVIDERLRLAAAAIVNMETLICLHDEQLKRIDDILLTLNSRLILVEKNWE